MFDMKVFEVSHTYMRQIGLHVPDNFNLFNIPAAALAGSRRTKYSVADQPAHRFGRHQPGWQSDYSALIAQLQSQANSLFSQPVATFGGGLTFFGLSLDQFPPCFP